MCKRHVFWLRPEILNKNDRASSVKDGRPRKLKIWNARDLTMCFFPLWCRMKHAYCDNVEWKAKVVSCLLQPRAFHASLLPLSHSIWSHESQDHKSDACLLLFNIAHSNVMMNKCNKHKSMCCPMTWMNLTKNEPSPAIAIDYSILFPKHL